MLTFNELMTPVWNTDTVFGESLTLVENSDGAPEAPLLFEPLKIIRIDSATFSETYEEGKDWECKGNVIRMLPGSRMPFFRHDELFMKEAIPDKTMRSEDGFIRYSEGDFFHSHQICVTYKCKKGGWTGAVPQYAGDVLKRTVKLLENGERLNMLAYGDSITWGANASRRIHAAPYREAYSELFCEALSGHYKSGIHYTNTAIGGTDSAWAVKNVNELVIDYNPDLVILAFGMNDIWTSADDFRENIRTIINKVREKKPETEFILVATSTPNPLAVDFCGNQWLFKAELDKLADETAGLAVADFTGMQQFLHSKKRFIDTTGNNINHPNDFLHRLWAQWLFDMLVKQEKQEN